MKRIIVTTALAVMLIAVLVLTTSCISVDGADALAMLEAANKTQLEEQKAEYEAKLEELESEYKAQIELLVNNYESELVYLRAQIEANNLDREALEERYMKELKAAYESMEAEKKELERVYTEEVEALRVQIAECEKKITEYTESLQIMEESYTQRITELERERDELKVKYQEKLAELEELYGSHSKELADLRAEYDTRIKKLEDELSDVKGQLANTNSYYESVLAEKSATIESLYSQINSINSEYNTQLTTLKDAHDREIAKLKSDYESTISSLSSQNAILNGKIQDLEARIADLTMSARYLVVIDYGLEGYGSTMMLVNGNACIDEPEFKVPDGYVLLCWMIDGAKIEFPYTVTSDVTIVANVLRDPEYPIMYHTLGGMLRGTVTNFYRSSVGVPILPTADRDGYVFAGWYDNPDYNGERITTIAPGTIGGKMLYARWTPMNDGVEYTMWGSNTSSPYYVVTGYSGTSSTAVIADEIDGIPVTTLKMGAFSGSTVSTLVIGNNVTTIDTSLAASTSLVEIRVSSENPKYKVENGFLIEEKDGVKKLIYYPTGRTDTYVNVPYGISSIGEWAFAGSDIQTINLPSSLMSIGNSAFETCYSLREVRGVSSVSYIGMWAFAHCEALESIVLPATLKSVDSYAFEYCNKLSGVFYCGTAFDWSMVNVKSGMNDSLLNATRYYYSASQPSDNGNYWYSNNGIPTPWIGTTAGSKGLTYARHTSGQTCMITGIGTCTDTDIIIPEYIDGYRVTEIGEGAFNGNQSIKSVYIPGSVSLINSHAFSNCSSLEKVYMEEGVTQIGYGAFRDSAVGWLLIPKSVEYIVDSFDGCKSLYAVYYGDDKAKWDEKGFSLDDTEAPNVVLWYYSDVYPGLGSNYWYYDSNGNPAAWV